MPLEIPGGMEIQLATPVSTDTLIQQDHKFHRNLHSVINDIMLRSFFSSYLIAINHWKFPVSTPLKRYLPWTAGKKGPKVVDLNAMRGLFEIEKLI